MHESRERGTTVTQPWKHQCNCRGTPIQLLCNPCATCVQLLYPPALYLGTALCKNRPLVLQSNSRTTFLYHRIGFFVALVDEGQLFRCAGQHFMCIAWFAVFGSILTSQNPSLSRSLSQLRSPRQQRSLAPRGSTDRNSGWCITGRRVSHQNQLNIRSFHAPCMGSYMSALKLKKKRRILPAPHAPCTPQELVEGKVEKERSFCDQLYDLCITHCKMTALIWLLFLSVNGNFYGLIIMAEDVFQYTDSIYKAVLLSSMFEVGAYILQMVVADWAGRTWNILLCCSISATAFLGLPFVAHDPIWCVCVCVCFQPYRALLTVATEDVFFRLNTEVAVCLSVCVCVCVCVHAM